MPTSSSAYPGQKTANSHLKWDAFITPSIPVVRTDFAPGERERPWPPISSTLIYGSRDAVLVDSFITQEQARTQADWIASTGKNLTTIYATHGHGGHFFGASVVWNLKLQGPGRVRIHVQGCWDLVGLEQITTAGENR